MSHGNIASLPMYWRPETAPHWAAFWEILKREAKDEGVILPDLTPPDALPPHWPEHWLSPDLALSMTCGLPFRSVLRDKVTYVATLDFGLGLPRGHYCSQVVIRPGTDPVALSQAGKLRLAFNGGDSQSGWAVTQSAAPFAAPLSFGRRIETGAHAASLAAVADHKADIAYIDAVTWRLLRRSDANAGRVEPHGRSVASPGLPLITALGNDPAPLRRALKRSLERTPADTAERMGGLTGMAILRPNAYFAVAIPKPPGD